jgi:hypothetical protein
MWMFPALSFAITAGTFLRDVFIELADGKIFRHHRERIIHDFGHRLFECFIGFSSIKVSMVFSDTEPRFYLFP